MNASMLSSRRGISLLEVLISIGILAIGLSAVVSLVPAGKSEAGKAVILDRAAALGMNSLNDAVTFGLTRPASFSSNSTFVIFDPLGSSPWPSATTGSYKSKGIFASGADADAPNKLLSYVLQGRDDLVYTAPTGDDDPPLNKLSDGVRSFQGRTTSLVSVASMPGGTLQAGELAKVTAVVFHNRNLDNPAETIVLGSYGAGKITFLPSDIPADRTLKNIIVPGTVIYDQTAAPDRRWLQTAMASADESDVGGPAIYVTFVGDVEPAPGAVIVALDSVGLAERVVTLEGPGPYGN